MKEVYILRHANWDGKEDLLTDQGIEAAKDKAVSFPQFNIVRSSPFVRARQTAKILGKETEVGIYPSASIPQAPDEIREQILARRGTHPLGIAGALFEEQKAHLALRAAGEDLVSLVKTTISELRDNEKALIISHDGTMLAAERVLTHTNFTEPLEHTYGELEGFVVNENLEVSRRAKYL